MSFLENIEEAKVLLDEAYKEANAIMSLRTECTLRQDIVDWLRACIANSELVLRSEQGDRTEIASAIKNGLLYPTSYGGVMATNEEVRDTFEKYVDYNRIMDSNKLAVRKGLTTQYLVKKACDSGEIVKIADFGNTVALFVD